MPEVQFSPRVDEDLEETYQDFVRFQNDGKIRGFYGPTIEDALSLHMILQADSFQAEQLEDFDEIVSGLEGQYDSLVSEVGFQKIRVSELFSTNVSLDGQKKQIGPNVEEQLSGNYKEFIRMEEGKFRGFFSQYVESAMALHMSAYFMENPGGKRFSDQNPEFKEYAIDVQQFPEFVGESVEPNENEELHPLYIQSQQFPELAEESVEPNEMGESHPYIQAIQYAQNGDFDHAWQQLAPVNPTESGYDQVIDTIRFYEQNEDRLEEFHPVSQNIKDP